MIFKEHRWFQHSSKTSAPLFGGYKPPPRVSSCSQLLAAEARHLGQGSKGKMLRVLFWLNCIELLYNPLTTYTLDLGKSRTFFFSPPCFLRTAHLWGKISTIWWTDKTSQWGWPRKVLSIDFRTSGSSALFLSCGDVEKVKRLIPSNSWKKAYNKKNCLQLLYINTFPATSAIEHHAHSSVLHLWWICSIIYHFLEVILCHSVNETISMLTCQDSNWHRSCCPTSPSKVAKPLAYPPQRSIPVDGSEWNESNQVGGCLIFLCSIRLLRTNESHVISIY